MSEGQRRWSGGSLIVALWSLLLALLVSLPWLTRSGFLLSYDMVQVPQWHLGRADLWGLSEAVPRAVPSDGVMALLSQIVDPALLQRVVLIGALVLGGLGCARLVAGHGLGARLVAATYAMWNPLIAERLVIGHWPVIVALGCLPWIIVSTQNRHQVRWAMLIWALAGTALSPATGVMGIVAALVMVRRAVWIRVGLLGLGVNAPWIVATLARGAAVVSDPDGIWLFAAQSDDGFWGRIGALASLGGIWNSDVVPDSRSSIVTAIILPVLWGVQIIGVRSWWRGDRMMFEPLACLAGLGYVIACAGWLAPDFLAWLVQWQGGFAMLRDGPRFLVLAVPFLVIALARGSVAIGAWVARAVSDRQWAAIGTVLVIGLPIAALPDLAGGVSGSLTPVSYPSSWARAADVIADSDVNGDLLSLPFQPYRAPQWNDDRTVLDPAGKYFDRASVVSDVLTISGTSLAAESPRVRRISEILADPRAVAADLAEAGIGIVVVDTSAPGGSDLPPVLDDAKAIGTEESLGSLLIFAIDDAQTSTSSSASRWAVILAWSAAGMLLVVALVIAVRGWYRDLRHRGGNQHDAT